MSSSYVGRFAPTPSGYLHFGSLVAAVASYLDARAVGGRWLVRMEDLDPPREVPGAQQAILETLERYGFEWDGAVERQSERFPAYAAVVEQLLRSGLAYACTCSRKQLEGFAGIYPGFCRDAGHAREDAAIRLRVPELEYRFVDRVQGEVRQHLGREVGDFVIQRRDGLYAYQLAVVLDDAWQGIPLPATARRAGRRAADPRPARARPAAAGRTGPGQRQRGAGLGRRALGRHAHPALRYPSRGTPVARPAACRHPPAACSLPAQA